MKHPLLILLIVLFATPALAADDDGLYTLYDQDKAYLRVVTPDLEPVKLNASPLPDAIVSPYYALKDSKATLQSGPDKQSLSLKKGVFHTAIRQKDGGFVLRNDERESDRAKAQIVLYNLTEAPLSLYAGDVVILENVPPSQSAARAVNPLSIEVVAKQGDKALSNHVSLSLQNGQAYSVFVFGKGKHHIDTATLSELP